MMNLRPRRHRISGSPYLRSLSAERDAQGRKPLAESNVKIVGEGSPDLASIGRYQNAGFTEIPIPMASNTHTFPQHGTKRKRPSELLVLPPQLPRPIRAGFAQAQDRKSLNTPVIKAQNAIAAALSKQTGPG